MKILLEKTKQTKTHGNVEFFSVRKMTNMRGTNKIN